MSEEVVEKIEITSGHELLLILKGSGRPSYQYIYREAAGVHWDNHLHGFKSTERVDWPYSRWFAHIVSVVKSGLGVELKLADEITWVNVPVEVQREIQAGHAI